MLRDESWLSGTPIQNDLLEYYSLVDLLTGIYSVSLPVMQLL